MRTSAAARAGRHRIKDLVAGRGDLLGAGAQEHRAIGRRVGIEGDAVALHGSPVFASSNPRALREPGAWVFDIVARAAGRASVRFEYRREGEAPDQSERTATFRFVVG